MQPLTNMLRSLETFRTMFQSTFFFFFFFKNVLSYYAVRDCKDEQEHDLCQSGNFWQLHYPDV